MTVTKLCKGPCAQDKPVEKFYKRTGNTSGRDLVCGDCRATQRRDKHRANPEPGRAAARLWGQNNAEVRRASVRLRTYGMTQAQYDERLAAQGGACAICRGTHPGRKGIFNMSVDHDHFTGRVRGLLCANCNKGIGFFKDSRELLAAAIVYLKEAALGR